MVIKSVSVLKVTVSFAIFMIFTILMSLPFIPVVSRTDDWKSAHIVGRFHDSDPPRPDQIFKIQYRVMNGTSENVVTPGSILFNLSSAENGLLEVKFPRNYPYHNDIQSTPAANFVFLNEKQNDVFESNVTATDCFFVFLVPFNDDADLKMTWAILLNGAEVRGDDIPASCITETVVEDVRVKGDGTIRPSDQLKAGVDPVGVLCPPGLEVIVSPIGKPYCATPSTADLLTERWDIRS